MVAQERGSVTRLSHGCLVRLGLRPDGSLCAPDDARKAQGTPTGDMWMCGAKRESDGTSFAQTFRVGLKTHIKCPSDTMITASGRGSGCCRDLSECHLCQQNESCQECSVLSGAGAVTTQSSTQTYSFASCYDTTKRVTCATTNQKCSNTNFVARHSTVIAQRRHFGRQNKPSGQHLVFKAGSGGSSFEMRAMLVVVAMMVGSCHAFPTLPPLSSSPSRAPQTAQEPLRKDLRVCCGDATVNMRPANVTVMRTSPTSVLVTWTRPSIQPLKYEITYKPTNAKYRVVAEVKAPLKSVLLERLLPLTQYQVFLTTVINNTTVWTSPVVTFQTSIEDANAPGNGTVRIFSTPTILEGVDVGVDDDGSVSDRKIGHVRVRAEEVGIVLLVLAVWMFAIALFFNRWGKIRMLEPYQEPYKEAPPQLLQHRPSCPMADPCALPINSLKRPSLTHPQLEYMGHRRPRQNSVFVGRSRSHSLEVHPPRRVKSALNLTTLVLQESEEEGAMATSFT